MTGRLNLTPRAEWAPAARERQEPVEHRCGRCYGPFGKSAIPCPNEPKQAQGRLLRDLQEHGYPTPEEES